MTIVNVTTARAVRAALLCGAASLALPVAAQAQQSGAPQQLEEIVVTGSRIARTDVTSASPISVINAEAFQYSGTPNVEDVLRRLPVASGAMTNSATNNGGRGTAQVNLRGLTVNRTLVLVNSRRMVGTDNLGTVIAVDLNNIPTAMIDRVEVLRDGASAVYGSDAIGGVVNVILRKNFDGARFGARYGMAGEGDGKQYDADATIGVNGEKGNVTLSVSHMKREAVLQSDRDFSRCQLNDVARAGGGFNIVCQGIQNGPSGVSGSTPGGQTYIFTGGQGFRLYDDLTDGFNPAPFSYLSTPQERYNVFGTAHYEIAPNVRAVFEGLYNFRDSFQALAPIPVPNLSVPINNPFIPAAFRQLALQASPTRTSIIVNRRFAEAGPRVTSQDAHTFRVLSGLEGDLDIAGRDWNWDASYQFGRSYVNESVEGNVRLDRINQALNVETVNGVVRCADAAARDQGCVPINLFGPGTISRQALNYVSFIDQSKRIVEMQQAAFNASGDLFDLPAGSVGLAFGGEYRKEFGSDTPDSLTASGQTTSGARTPTRGSYTVREVYGETNVPLLKDVTLADMLSLNAALRWSDYSNIQDPVTSYRVGGEWSPIEDIRFRGVYSKAFRAPNIRELFAGVADSFVTSTDPCSNWAASTNANVRANCQADGVPTGYRQSGVQTRTRIGGNPNLTEEAADTYTLGAVLTPSFIEDLSITVDYYDIRLEDAIASVPVQTKLNLCYQSANRSHPFCRDISRQADGSSITSTLQENLSSIETSGIDYSVNYALDLPDAWGRLSWFLQATYLMKRDIVTFAGAPLEQYAGWISNAGSFTRWRAGFRTTWDWNDLTLSHNLRYVGAAGNYNFKVPGSSATDGVPEIWYHDISVQYRMEPFTFTAGVNNLFERYPPYYRNSVDSNTDINTYDVLGRYIFVGLSAEF